MGNTPTPRQNKRQSAGDIFLTNAGLLSIGPLEQASVKF